MMRGNGKLMLMDGLSLALEGCVREGGLEGGLVDVSEGVLEGVLEVVFIWCVTSR